MTGILERLQDALEPTFWPTVAIVSVALIVISVRTQSQWADRSRPLIPRDWGAVWCLAVSAPVVWSILRWSDFGYHDDDAFLEATLIGIRYPLSIRPGQGRYFPLMVQEFNVLAEVSASRWFYYGAVAAQLIVLALVVNAVLSELRPHWRGIAMALVLWPSATTIVFIEADYPDRNIVFLVAVLMLALQRFDRRPTRLNMFTATLASFLALYFKEPTVLIIATIAVVRLLRWRAEAEPRSWRRLRERPLELCMLGVSALFLVQIGIVLAGPGSDSYVEEASLGPVHAFFRYMRTTPILYVFAAALAIRVVELVRSRRIDGVWDAAALGAIAYFFAMVSRGLAVDRYMGPVVLVAAMFSVRVVARLWAERPRVRVGAAVVLALALVLSLGSGAMRVIEHTSVVEETQALGDFVARRAADSSEPVVLFFPDSLEYRIMNFAVSLNSRHPEAIERIRITSPHEFPDGRCVSYVRYECSHADGPTPGDLIVHLADDTTRRTPQPGDAVIFDDTWIDGDVPSFLGAIYYPQMPLNVSGGPMPDDWLHTTVWVAARDS